MKVIILNSGMGTRLKELTEKNPKSLVKINENDTIFSRAIKILSKFEINEFIITTGHYNHVLIDYCTEKFSNIDFKFVHNPIYDKTNYIKSLDLIDDDIDDDVILLHGDLVFSEEVAKKIINSNETCVVIDSTLPIPQDDFKAKVKNNQIIYIGVDYFDSDAVTCQPFYKLKNKEWKAWKNKIREFCNNNQTDVYAENALNQLTSEINIKPLDLKGLMCMEIDTKDDLKKVKEILK